MKSFLIFLLLLILSTPAFSRDYDIQDIRVLGLQRMSASVVFSSMQIQANSTINDSQLQQVIRDLYDTGFFERVNVGLDGTTLIVTVQERPVISNIILEGNKVIETDSLLEALKSIGLAEGEVFKQAALNEVAKELNAQYSAQGRYSAEIETQTRRIQQNQIVVGIKVKEGKVAKIKHINVVGNENFSDKQLKDLFDLDTTGTWSWMTGNDKYGKEKLSGDLERLESFYLNRGYLKFAVTSTQVSISPDKETVYVTINIDEGEKYTVSEVDLSGDPVLPEDEIRKLFLVRPESTFSQLLVTLTEETIQRRLGNDGYSNAKVSGIPEINEEDNTVKMNFFIKPGEISYVRRIIFSGNTATADSVLRREMRQLEGAPVSADKIERSKVRLQRLGIFSGVEVETREVPGSTDQVDVEYTVEEQSSASINLSLGYSENNGVTIGAGLQHNNWLGTGNTFGFDVSTSRFEDNFSLNFRNPYYTKDGVSRGISLFYRERDYDEINVSNFATDTAGMRVTFGYPISESGRLNFGLGFENIKVEAGTTTSQEIQGTPITRNGISNAFISNDFYENTILPALGDSSTNTVAQNIDLADTNNNGFTDEFDSIRSVVDLNALSINDTSTDYGIITDPAALNASEAQGFLDLYGDSFNNFNVSVGWVNSTFNRGLFPTDGLLQRLDLEVSVPGGDLEFFKLTYRGDWYIPITNSTSFRLHGRLGYGDSYGDIEGLPFFENFFAGGIGSVRGFEPSSLGPKATPADAYIAAPIYLNNTDPTPALADRTYVYVGDGADFRRFNVGTIDDSFGGNTLVELGLELVFKLPFVDSDKMRTTLFVDSGNVFSDNCGPLQRNCGDLDLNKLSVAAGFGFQWISPVGPMSFSFSTPLVEQPFDQTEEFQFTLGRSF
jgi:outer membrane protein insertion porin family